MSSLNSKTLKKPYGLYRTQFLTQLFAEAFERKIINSSTNLSDYETILGPKATKIFKPEMWQALEELRLNRVRSTRNPTSRCCTYRRQHKPSNCYTDTHRPPT